LTVRLLLTVLNLCSFSYYIFAADVSNIGVSTYTCTARLSINVYIDFFKRVFLKFARSRLWTFLFEHLWHVWLQRYNSFTLHSPSVYFFLVCDKTARFFAVYESYHVYSEVAIKAV